MKFYPYEPFDTNNAHNKLWDWLKEAFNDEPGVAFYRYPVFTGNFLREPDILLFHRRYGLWIFECKGCTINKIAAIHGHLWQMHNWHSEEESPLLQAEDQMFAVQNKLNGHRELRGRINYFFRAALPLVKSKEWKDKDFTNHTGTSVWLYEDLTPSALKMRVESAAQEYPQLLDDQTWELAIKVLGGTLPSITPRQIPTTTPPISPIRVIHEIELNLKVLDETQQKIAFEIPDGPQRLRGLAGTGKTVLFAKRIAKMHIKHPNWDIGFIFFTQSLYEQIRRLIVIYCRELGDREPDWQKIKVMHSWGGAKKEGFYSNLAERSRVRPLRLFEVQEQIPKIGPNKAFEYVCLSLVINKLRDNVNHPELVDKINKIRDLEPEDILNYSETIQNCYLEAEEKNIELFPQFYDALFIDEGQDLPSVCYKLFFSTLKDFKRLYWAYDEAQGIGSLTIPTSAAIFGRDTQNRPRVDVTRAYPGGIQKSHRMYRCYRTPRLLLMTAHALNMGLARQGGPLQGVTTREEWEALGYTITEGDFSLASVNQGRTVTITREQKASPHPVDQENFNQKESLGDLLIYKAFDSELNEITWVAQQVAEDLKLGFKPEDLIITAVGGDYDKKYMLRLKETLAELGVDSFVTGVDGNPDQFKIPGYVTISNIFRTKGNEAWKVYVCRFHYVNQPAQWKGETELVKRNEAFVALTRSKVWCVVTGLEDKIFDEMEKIISNIPNITFPAFNKTSLSRITEDII